MAVRAHRERTAPECQRACQSIAPGRGSSQGEPAPASRCRQRPAHGQDHRGDEPEAEYHVLAHAAELGRLKSSPITNIRNTTPNSAR